MNTETHPLQPFLPANAKILMLGSFPPQRKRWSMEWFYPNIQNDMWRIFGLIFFHNKDYFYDSSLKAFKLDILRPFMEEKGIAIYDTATEVRRLKNNASDAFLEVVRLLTSWQNSINAVHSRLAYRLLSAIISLYIACPVAAGATRWLWRKKQTSTGQSLSKKI